MKTLNLVALFVLYVSLTMVFAQEPVLTVNTGHPKMVNSVCFSHDGKYGLSGCIDGNVKLWEISTGKLIRTFTGNSGRITSVCFSPDSKYAISGHMNGTLKLWDISTGKDIRTLKLHSDEWGSVYLSAEGNFALSKSGDNTLKFFEISTGREIQTFTGTEGSILAFCLSPNGKYALSSGMEKDNSIKLWETSTGKLIKTFIRDSKEVESLCFSPDGKYFLSNNLELWELSTGKKIRTFYENSQGVNSVCFSSDSKYTLSGGVDMKLWEISTGSEITTFKGFSKSILAVCFSTDGKYALSGGADNTVKLWDVSTGKEVRPIGGQSGTISSINFSPNGKYLLSGSGVNGVLPSMSSNIVQISDLLTGQTIKTFVGSVGYFIPNSENILTYNLIDYTFNLREISTEKNLLTFTSDPFLSVPNYSPDGKYAARALFDNILKLNVIKLWDISTGKLVSTFKGHTSVIYSVCFSHDSKFLLSGCSDNTIKLWDISTGNEIRTIKNESTAFELRFSPDGKYALSGNEDNTIKLWDISTGTIIRSFLGSWSKPICFSPDSRNIIIPVEKTLKLIEISTGKEIKTFIEQNDLVSFACFSPDGKFLFSNGSDKKIIIWNVETGGKICSLFYFNNKDWLVITPEGRFEGSEGGLKQLYYVKGLEIIPLDNLFEQFYTPSLFARIMEGEQFASLQVNISDLSPKPLVKITSPENNTRLSSEQINVTVEVTDQGGGIDEILLYHNGKLIETSNRGFKAVVQIDSKTTKIFSITLMNGENKIKATAFNTQRTEAIADEIIVNYSGNIAAKPDLYLFVIGINQYKNTKYNLNYATADAEAFIQHIEQGGGTIFGSIKTSYISNSNATKSKITEEINKIKLVVKKEDVFIFYYAGHGIMSEVQVPQFYIIPSDVTQLYGNDQALQSNAISANELKQFSTEIKAQKQIYFLDACQSGGMTGMLASRGAAEEKSINQLARSTGTFWLAASSSEQFAGEFAQLGHGIFTYCILQGLSGKADGQNDKKITIQELNAYLNDQVPILSKQYKGSEQYPNTFGYGQDFPIVIIK